MYTIWEKSSLFVLKELTSFRTFVCKIQYILKNNKKILKI